MEPANAKARLDWALDALEARGLTAVARPEAWRRSATSTVAEIPTRSGPVDLVVPEAAAAAQADLAALLHRLAPDHVPEMLAANATLGCWLSRSAGEDLDPRFLPSSDFNRLSRFLDAHSALQAASVARLGDLKRLGLRDLRPGNYRPLLDRFLGATELLPDSLADRLTGSAPRLAEIAVRLAGTGLPDTLTHMDLRRDTLALGPEGIRPRLWTRAAVGPAMLDPVPLYGEIASQVPDLSLYNRLRAHQRRLWHGDAADIGRAQTLCGAVFPLLYAAILADEPPQPKGAMAEPRRRLVQGYLSIYAQRIEADGLLD